MCNFYNWDACHHLSHACPDMLCEDSQNQKGARSCKVTNYTDTTEFTWVLTNDVSFIFCVVSYIPCSHPKILPCFAQLCKLMQAARDWRVFSVGLCHLCHRLRHFFPTVHVVLPYSPGKPHTVFARSEGEVPPSSPALELLLDGPCTQFLYKNHLVCLLLCPDDYCKI